MKKKKLRDKILDENVLFLVIRIDFTNKIIHNLHFPAIHVLVCIQKIQQLMNKI